MNQVSQFTIHEQSTLQAHHSLTPQSIAQTKRELQCKTTDESNEKSSNFKCNQCSQHLSSLTQIKKRQILLEYEIEKLKEQIQKLKRQKTYLIDQQSSIHYVNIQKYNPIMYFKQDLQSQLQQAKYLLQLHTLSKAHQFSTNPTKLTGRQSKKQKQFYQHLTKQVDLKKKCEDLLFQNVKLQQKCMIKDKIIEERSLFPFYHYDQRVLTLRKAVQFWYKKAGQQSFKLTETLAEVRKMQKQLKKQAKLMVQQEKVYWQTELNKIISQLSYYSSTKTSQNQDSQKNRGQKDQNRNILIEDDHTILSLCQNIKTKKNQNQSKSRPSNTLNQICNSCQRNTEKQNLSKTNISKPIKSINKSAKSSAKNQSKHLSRENHGVSKKTSKKQAINSSMMGKNFAQIQIKINPKQKSDDHICKKNNSTSVRLSQTINCQRCAERMV